MPRQCEENFTGGYVPHLRGLVLAGRGHARPVRAEGEALDRTGVTGEDSQFPAREA
jgi:hypothetical protein